MRIPLIEIFLCEAGSKKELYRKLGTDVDVVVVGPATSNHLLEFGAVFGEKLLIGVDLKKPVARCIGGRLIAVLAEIVFPGMVKDTGAEAFCDPTASIRGTRIHRISSTTLRTLFKRSSNAFRDTLLHSSRS